MERGRQIRNKVNGQYLPNPVPVHVVKAEKSVYDKARYQALKDYKRAYQKQYEYINREYLKEYKRWAAIKRKYGISKQDYNNIFKNQGEVCAICKSDDHNSTNFHVDHCHSTGAVRGILCKRCNTGLGYFEKYGLLFTKYLEDTKGD